MKIAQVAPLYESVPPKTYGGTERVVSYLTEELVAQGHQVTLFASADSQTQAELIPICKKGLRSSPDCLDPIAYHIIQLQEVVDRAHEFDIINFHTDYLHYPVSSSNNYLHLTTLHGRLDMPDLIPVYKKFNRVPLISISNNQRLPVKDANWVKTIYHGLPTNLYQCGPGSGNYLAFIGRISPEKRVDRAIEIAKKTGIPLRIAAKIDKADEEYFETQIRHLFDDPIVDYVGEIGEHEKEDFLGNALGMLFPIDWPEPFGLVMIESMACGTPVIAYAGGSVPEVIENGITGFIANSIEESVSAVNRIHTIDRRECRKRFEQRFSSPVMALNYVSTYQMLIEKNNNRLMRKLGTFQ